MMYSDTLCSNCGLTVAATSLLAEVVRDMRRTRGDGDSWWDDICPACGKITGVYDDREGWAMGHRAPVAEAEVRPAFVSVP